MCFVPYRHDWFDFFFGTINKSCIFDLLKKLFRRFDFRNFTWESSFQYKCLLYFYICFRRHRSRSRSRSGSRAKRSRSRDKNRRHRSRDRHRGERDRSRSRERREKRRKRSLTPIALPSRRERDRRRSPPAYG